MKFDPIGLLRVLVDHEVEFVVVGGVAAAARGSPTSTVDLDVCYQRVEGNLNRLAEALEALGARLRGVDEELPFILDAKALRAGDHFTLTTDLGDLDLLGTPAGTSGYEDLATQATVVDLDGFTVQVAGIEDLIRMKKAAGRPKDRVELEILGALREEMKRRGT
jgi:hypothetical protein